VRTPIILELFAKLPKPTAGDDPEMWSNAMQEALDEYRRQVELSYSESTLVRLLDNANKRVRRAAVVALGLMGTMSANTAVARRLVDPDRRVRQFATDALWAIWFRGHSEKANDELQRIVRDGEPKTMLKSLDSLVRKAGDFAEAYNQRAILYYRLGEFRKAIVDCEKVLQLNPHHFGAAAGMAQCYLKLNKPRAALRSFRTALEINPNLDDVEETIKALEEVLGED
jgi:tetratricopeptide (TPR) repeat protein